VRESWEQSGRHEPRGTAHLQCRRTIAMTKSQRYHLPFHPGICVGRSCQPLPHQPTPSRAEMFGRVYELGLFSPAREGAGLAIRVRGVRLQSDGIGGGWGAESGTGRGATFFLGPRYRRSIAAGL